jgi:hypothetical protein
MTGERLDVGYKKLLKKVSRNEQTALVTGFLEEDEPRARAFIKYCSSRAHNDRSLDRGWTGLGRSLETVVLREKREAGETEKQRFIKRLGKFRKDCLDGKNIQDADEDDKRHARSDGDYYLEDFQETFVDDHDGIQAFLDDVKTADKYFRQGDSRTAAEAYRLLMDIYRHDTEVEHCFVLDDDFPDLDLSQVDGVDIDEIKKRCDECVRTIEDRRK